MTNTRKNTNYSYCLRMFIALLICCMFRISYAQTGGINIRQAIDIALTNNYGLRADSLNITAADFKNKETAGNYLPQLKLSSKVNYNMAIPSQMLAGSIAGQPEKDLVPVKFGTKYDAGAGAELTQTIYRRDLMLQIRSADLNTGIAHTKYNLSKEDMIYQVAAAYYGLQSNAEKIRTTTSDYKNLKDVLAIAKNQFENGTLKRIDYESLQINVANKQSQLNQLKTQYNQQLSYFKYLLGVPDDATLRINDSITALPQITLATEGYLNREDIHLYSQLIQSKEVEMKTIKAEALPVLSTYLRYNYNSQFSTVGKFFNNDYWFNSSTVGLSLSVNLFDGNRRKNRLNYAGTELQQLKWEKEQQQQKAMTELVTARETLNNNREQFGINAQNLTLAEKVFTSRRALYTEGVSSLVELLDAENELSKARDLYIQSLIDVQTGMLDVHKAKGTLLTGFLGSL